LRQFGLSEKKVARVVFDLEVPIRIGIWKYNRHHNESVGCKMRFEKIAACVRSGEDQGIRRAAPICFSIRYDGIPIGIQMQYCWVVNCQVNLPAVPACILNGECMFADKEWTRLCQGK
jgi:hypothetical protein